MDIEKLFPEKAKQALSKNAAGVVSEIGHDVIADVVLSVLVGENIRNSTELLTQKRLLTLNAAMLYMLIRGINNDSAFGEKLHDQASSRLINKGITKNEKWILQWLIGLTDKGFQNVLRDNRENLKKYTDEYKEIMQKSAEESVKLYGHASGHVRIGDMSTELDWGLFLNLMSAVGSQTLAIRGSDKSTFGKLFEKLVLGSLLTILGFSQVDKDNIGDGKNVFWLSDRQKRRESDATLIFEKGKGVRFDIGSIGRGNPEISLDKVTRFEREIELDATKHYITTIIIVDRIGANSRIEELAREVDGYIVQMSGGYWPQMVAEKLRDRLGYDDEILHVKGVDLRELLEERLKRVDFTKLIEKVFEEE